MVSYRVTNFYKNLFRDPFRRYSFVNNASTSLASEKNDQGDSSLSSVKTKEKKPPFVKNLLLGVYDSDLLIFPEILNGRKLKTLEAKYFDIQNATKDSQTAEKLLGAINKVDESQLVPGSASEQNLLATEITKFSEAVTSPALSLKLEISNNLIYQLIQKYGSKQQNEKYLHDLSTGKLVAAYALSEDLTGSDPSRLSSIALKLKDTDEWQLQGSKVWVTNAQKADLFVVFCKTNPDRNQLSVFLLNRETVGLSVEPLIPIGLEECGFGKVKFDVILKNENLLGSAGQGYDIAVEFLSSYKFYLSSCFSHQLKQFLSHAVKFVSPRKQTLVDLKDCELIRNDLGHISSVIYALDSMIYLTAGMLDKYEMDTAVESAIIQVYCSELGMKAVDKCMGLLGSQVYDRSLPYDKLWRDLKGLSIAAHTKNINKLFITLSSLKHVGESLKEEITKLRNSFNFPVFFVKKLVSNMRQRRDSPKLGLELYQNLHPSLQISATQMEYCVVRLQYAVEIMLTRAGSDIVNRQLDLERITDVLIEIFAMTAVLSRASRSYCTGILCSDEEIKLARLYCQDSAIRCKHLLSDVIEGGLSSNDVMRLKVGDDIVKHGGYFVEHPLVQNIS